MAVAMLISFWIYDEITFNNHFKNYNHIAHVMRKTMWNGEVYTGGQSSPMPLASELRSSFGADFELIVMSTHPVNAIVAYEENKFTQSGRFMEAKAGEMFSLSIKQGSYDGLTELNSILLSSSLAKKLFNDADPINKTLMLDTKVDVTVIGIYEDFPNNSDFYGVTFIAPFDLFVSMNIWAQKVRDKWSDSSFPVYVQIKPGVSFELISGKIKDAMLPYIDIKKEGTGPEVFLHPMKHWHLHSQFKNGLPIMSEPMKFIWFYGIVGVFVVLLACINFMNLSTARAQERTKEVGILKTVGSTKEQLIARFLSESLWMVIIAFVLCVLVVRLSLPWFNEVAGKQIEISWTSPVFLATGIVFILFTSILSGSYPAFYLSSLQTAKVIKGSSEKGRTLLRRTLVVLQFTISTALIAGTIVVYQQMMFAKGREAGYNRYGLLSIPKHSSLRGNTELLRTELIKTGVVEEMSESSSRLTAIRSNNSGFDWRGKDPELNEDFGTFSVGYEYGKAIRWEILLGRDFSHEIPGDSTSLIINEAAAKMVGFENPIGEFIQSNFLHRGKSFQIIGVTKDMVMESPFTNVKPAIFFLGEGSWIFIRLSPSTNVTQALPEIEKVMRRMVPEVPFEYKFVDEEYAMKFSSEERITKLASVFTSLAILISCLGIFGLASFVAQQRTKEISIRKVLGASIFNLLQILSREFVILVIISCLVSVSISHYFLKLWLQHYQYHVEISAWMYATIILVVTAIALLTVSLRTLKVAMTNPVKSLKSE